MKTYRVVQWATGNIGTRALRSVIEHPTLDLAGVYVHTPDKVGRDAGELCGLDPVGVVATNDIEDVVALGADCVLYMPRALDAGEVCRLLAAGANVVTIRGDAVPVVCAAPPGIRTTVDLPQVIATLG